MTKMTLGRLWRTRGRGTCGMKSIIMVRKVLSGLLMYVVAIGAWPQESPNRSDLMQDTPRQNNTANEAPVPVRYPYPPEELWRRLIQVAKTPPVEVTVEKIEQIFGVKFDDTKLLLWGSEEEQRQKKYFSANQKDLKEGQNFPFKTLDIVQFPERKGPGTRDMVFRFEVFDSQLNESLLYELAGKYCVKPVASDLERVGYKYSLIMSLLASQKTYRHRPNNFPRPRIDVYVLDEKAPLDIDTSITVTLLPSSSDCLNKFEFGHAGY